MAKVHKKLFMDIKNLEFLDTDDAKVRFRLKESPCINVEDEVHMVTNKYDEYIITGQIFPNSDIYRERSYLIEITLLKTFPLDPPTVRFLTPIYHPNVSQDGIICNALLQKTHRWAPQTSLVEVIKSVVDQIDHPDIDSSQSYQLGLEYVENRSEFNRKALEWVRKHGLPR